MDLLVSLLFLAGNLLLLLIGFAIPGYLLSRRLVRSSGPLETAVFSAALGISVIPTLVFLAMLALQRPLSMGLVLAVGLLVTLACRPWRLERLPTPSRNQVLLLVSVVVASLVFLQLIDFRDQEPYSFFDACVRWALLKHTLQDGSGWSLYNAEMGDFITYVFRAPADHGLSFHAMLEDVRPAASMLLGSFVLLIGAGADEVLSLVVYFIVLGGSVLIASRWLSRTWAAVLVALVSVVGLHGVLAYMQNENAYGLAMGIAILALVIERPLHRAEYVVVGILLGFATGLRLPALLWVLPVGLLLARAPRRQIATVFVSFLASWAPWAILFWVVRGDPLFIANDSWGIETELFGFTVWTRPLNWPLYESLVRVPGNDLPAMLYVPARFLLTTGSVIASAMVIGFVGLRPRKNLPFPRLTVFTWVAPITALLLIHVYTDDEKVSYLAIALATAPLLLARFAQMMATRRLLPAVVGSWVLLSVGLAFVPKLLVDVDVPIDPRANEYVIRGTNYGQPWWARDPEERRRRLDRLAFFPRFTEIEVSSALLDHLSHPPTGPMFESGRILVSLADNEELRETSIPVRATLEEPLLPEFGSSAPEDVDFIANHLLVVHLRLETSPEPTVLIDSRPERLRLAIDPGPPPHEPRFISFHLDENLLADLEYTPGVGEDAPRGRRPEFTVEVGGVEVPALGLGYQVEVGGEVLDYISIVTNLELPELPPARGEMACEEGQCEYWVVYHDGTSILSGREASAVDRVEGDPAWPSQQLLEIRHPYQE